jgi:hypothetical protein
MRSCHRAVAIALSERLAASEIGNHKRYATTSARRPQLAVTGTMRPAAGPPGVPRKRPGGFAEREWTREILTDLALAERMLDEGHWDRGVRRAGWSLRLLLPD